MAPPAPPRIVPGLDGIRAVAIILVILWHCLSHTGIPAATVGPLLPVVTQGWAGVDLFFALSGFLITGLVLDEERATGRRLDLGRFYARRALRIFPAFYLVLGLDLLLRRLPVFHSLAGAGQTGPFEVVAVATYWSNYYYAAARALGAPALALFWSLCVEEQFYLFWPVFLAAVRGTRARVMVALGICVLLPWARWVAMGTSARRDVNMLSHFRMDSLMWGALAALLLPRLLRERRACRLMLAAVTAALAVLYAPLHLGVDVGAFAYGLALSLLALWGSLLGLEVTLAPNGYLARALSLSPLRAVGRVSYGMYLLHFHVIDLLTAAAPTVVRGTAPGSFVILGSFAVVGTFAVAAAMYGLYERPFLRLKGRFTPPRQAIERPPEPADPRTGVLEGPR
jgi:peptidoglycan/LPS O-acetylase OafA/YrhL